MSQSTATLLTLGSTPPPPRRRKRRFLRVLGLLTVLALLLAGGLVWLNSRLGSLTLVSSCEATALANTARLDPEQAGNAAMIAAVAVRRGLPARAATIGIATAIQESKLRNIDYGDRDSVGLFQQRPSQGWGTRAEILDPLYATNAFFDVLVKIEGYQSLPITDAAQKVQRSAFPSAYADHEEEARVFASALAGHSTAALTCRLRAPEVTAETAGNNGLTPRAQTLAESARAETGRSGKAATGSAAPTAAKGTAVSFALSGSESARLGWALAQWAVASADRFSITSVAVNGHRWSRDDGTWTTSDAAPGPGSVVVTVA